MHSVHNAIQFYIICVQLTCGASAESCGDIIDVLQEKQWS